MNPEDKVNPAEQLASTPVRWSISAVAIALMFTLAADSMINAVVQNQLTQVAAVQMTTVSSGGEKTKANESPLALEARPSNRIIVKFKDEAKVPPGLSVAAERANLEKAQGLVKVLTINGIDADVFEVSEDDSAQEVVDRLLASKRDLIEYAEVDMEVPLTLVPNDTYYKNQWHHPIVQNPVAWDTSLGEGIIVATLDTGLDTDHPDLVMSSVPHWNFFNNNNDLTDNYGHGTKVAGTAAANGNNALGVSGVAPRATHLGLRISDDSGYGSWSRMAQALTYAADNGARVANISFGNSCNSATVNSAASYMRGKGGVVTVSAGNSGADNGMAESAVITCVSATGSNDLRTSWSSWGASVDVSAPGASIYSTVNGGGYGSVSGTSFSAPLTAGIYALMFSVNPALTPTQADNILFSTADDLGEPGWNMYYGHGRVNAAKAVAAAKAAVGTRDTVPPSVPTNLRTTSVKSTSVALAWNASTDDNSGVAGYSVYRNGTKLSTVSGTAYTDTGVSPSTTYTYIVSAEDNQGNVSTSSAPLSVTTPEVEFGISAYSVTGKTDTQATISTTLTKPGNVIVRYGTTAGNLTMTASSSSTGTTHAVTLTGLTAATTYYYQVVAMDGATTLTSPTTSFKTNRASKGGGGGGKGNNKR